MYDENELGEMVLNHMGHGADRGVIARAYGLALAVRRKAMPDAMGLRVCTYCMGIGTAYECDACHDAEGGCPTLLLTDLIGAQRKADALYDALSDFRDLLRLRAYDEIEPQVALILESWP